MKKTNGNRINNIDDFDHSTKPMALFFLSNSISKKTSEEFLTLSKQRRNSKRKIENVRSIKKVERELYIKSGAFAALKRDFHIDGAIKLDEKEIIEFKKFLDEEIKNENLSTASSKAVMDEYASRFGYFSGKNFIFRGQKYYFLLNGIEIEDFNPFTSINDLIIKDINADEFIDSICDQYNSINEQFKIYGAHVLRNFYGELLEKKKEFCADIKDALSEERIFEIRKKIKSGIFNTNHELTDEMLNLQWEDSLAKLERFRKLVERYEKSETSEEFNMMVHFFMSRSPLFAHCKIVFGIDIDSIVESHFEMKMPEVVRKIVLGLIDAKLNILAFVQNVFQIITNANFLDPDYQGSLVVEQDIVRNIKNTCPTEFSEFKNLQKNYVKRYLQNPVRGKIDEVVGLSMDIMLSNTAISYLRLFDFGSESKKDIDKGEVLIPRVLKDFIDITKGFFKLLAKFVTDCEIAEQKKEQKIIKKGLVYVPGNRHIRIKQQVFKRLIRLYREENSPLVMIKTAQNALNFVLLRGYEARNDVLHIMSVNYGGALTGFFAKQVFLRCVKNGQALANTASIIYSLYDVKNANSFARLTGYPFSDIIADKTMSKHVRENFSKKNWLLIFDDNTNSGETLDNIRVLAKDTGFFGRIDMFPCRASFIFDNYKNSLNEHQKLAMIVSSALEVRRSKVNREKLRYKELLGTIVGHRLWKIKNNNQT